MNKKKNNFYFWLLACVLTLLFGLGIWYSSRIYNNSKAQKEITNVPIVNKDVVIPQVLDKDEIDANSIANSAYRLDQSTKDLKEDIDDLEYVINSARNHGYIDYDYILSKVEKPDLSLSPKVIDGYTYSVCFEVPYNDEIAILMEATDRFGNCYDITTEIEYGFMGDSHIAHSYSVDPNYEYLGKATKGVMGDLFYLYKGMEDNPYDEETYLALKDHLRDLDNVWPNMEVALDEGTIEARGRFRICDVKTGEIYYSDWSDYTYVGKDEIMQRAFDFRNRKPVIADSILLTHDYGGEESYEAIITLEKDDLIEDAAFDQDSRVMVEIWYKAYDGNYYMQNTIPYESILYNGEISIPITTYIKTDDMIDVRGNKATFKLKYQWYNASSVYNDMTPNSESDFTEVEVSR